MGKNIMCVDNEKYVVDIMRIILEKEGYVVTEALSGEECLKKVNEKKPDLILLDIMMPGMDGWQVLEQLKRNESVRDVPVAMLTVKEQTLSDEELKEKGAVDYITKPFVREDLVKRVKALLGE